MNMSYDLRNYLVIYDNFLELDFCNSLVKKLNNVDWQKHCYTEYDGTLSDNNEHELNISRPNNLPEYDIIYKKIWNAVYHYIKKNNETMPWFGAWNGYTPPRFNQYKKDTFMQTHCDHIYSIFGDEGTTNRGVPILSVLGALNDDYDGGDLIFWEQEKIELKAGQLMIFPSNFLYPHRVDPIKTGVRYSYVSWVW